MKVSQPLRQSIKAEASVQGHSTSLSYQPDNNRQPETAHFIPQVNLPAASTHIIEQWALSWADRLRHEADAH